VGDHGRRHHRDRRGQPRPDRSHAAQRQERLTQRAVAVRDHEGRAGTGVAISASGERHELILDPATSQLLGEQSVNTATGHVDAWTSYLKSRYVGAVPAGGTTLATRP
jgi:hypothetical protein